MFLLVFRIIVYICFKGQNLERFLDVVLFVCHTHVHGQPKQLLGQFDDKEFPSGKLLTGLIQLKWVCGGGFFGISPSSVSKKMLK